MRRAGRQKNRRSPSLFVNICFLGKITFLCSHAVPISRKPLSGSELVTFWNRGLRSSLFASPATVLNSDLTSWSLTLRGHGSSVRSQGPTLRSDTAFLEVSVIFLGSEDGQACPGDCLSPIQWPLADIIFSFSPPRLFLPLGCVSPCTCFEDCSFGTECGFERGN